jgi:hypothetical protein
MVAVSKKQLSEDSAAAWFGTDDVGAFAPWQFDAGGNPIEAPEEAIGQRARFIPIGSRGMGEVVIDERTGLPAFFPKGIGPEEFAALVGNEPGRYRLVFVDERHQIVSDAPIAVVSITPRMAALARQREAAVAPPPSAPAPSMAEGAMAETLNLMRTIVTEREKAWAEREKAWTAELRAATAANAAANAELRAELRAVIAERDRSWTTILTESFGVIKTQASDGARNTSELVRAASTVVIAAHGAGIAGRAPLPVPVAPVALAAPVPEEPGAAVAETVGTIVEKVTDKLGPVLNHFINTKLMGLSNETSAAMIRAQAKGVPLASPAATAGGPIGAATPAAGELVELESETYQALAKVWPAIEQLLSSDERTTIGTYLGTASAADKQTLARQVVNRSSRSVAEAVQWIRSMLSIGAATAR